MPDTLPYDHKPRYVSDQQTAGDDSIHGTEMGDIVLAGAGNDIVSTGAGNDTLVGGIGDDSLQGGSNVDTYIYNPGDGDDIILDSSFDSSPDDILVFGEGIMAADLIFSASPLDAQDRMITFAGSAGSILLDEQTGNSGIEIIQFSDGSILTEAQFMI